MKFSDIKLGYVYMLKMPHGSEAVASWDKVVFNLIHYKNKVYLIQIHKGNPRFADKITEIGGDSLIAEEGIVTIIGTKETNPEYFL